MLPHLTRRACAGVAVLLALQLMAALPAHAARFEFDRLRTEVRFVYTWGYWTQRGRFTSVTGTMDYDAARPEKCQVIATIATASLTTGVPIFDYELKGASFFNAKDSPVIAFKSRLVKPTGEGAAEVSGDMTINGITKPVSLKVNVRALNDPALKHNAAAREFVATTRIQRSAFKMTGYRSLVADDVDIEIHAILRRRT